MLGYYLERFIQIRKLSNKKTLSSLPDLQKHLIFQLLKTVASMSMKSNEGENSLPRPHFSSTHDH